MLHYDRYVFIYTLMSCIVRDVLDLVVSYAFQKVVCTVCSGFLRNRKGEHPGKESLRCSEKRRKSSPSFFSQVFVKWWGTTSMVGFSNFQGVSRSVVGALRRGSSVPFHIVGVYVVGVSRFSG